MLYNKTECINHLEAISLGVKLYNIIIAQTGLFLTQFPNNKQFDRFLFRFFIYHPIFLVPFCPFEF